MTNDLNEFLKIMYSHCGTTFIDEQVSNTAWIEFCKYKNLDDIIDMWESYLNINIANGNLIRNGIELRLSDQWVENNIGINIIKNGYDYD